MATDIRQWIEINPLDTLFFRGSEPMVAGQSHEVQTVFPPMPSTIMGALRTAILAQRGVDLATFLRHKGDGPAVANLPLLGTVESPGFSVAGPLIEAEIVGDKTETFLPVPAHWFGETGEGGDEIRVCAAKICLKEAATLGLAGGSPSPLLIESPPTTVLKNLHGFWANNEAFAAVAKGVCLLAVVDDLKKLGAGKPFLLRPAALFDREPRTGIALDFGARRVRKGHLYASTHVRLSLGVRLIVGLSVELIPSHLDTDGLLQLGGEQRLVRYFLRQEKVSLPTSATGWAMALSPVEFDTLRQVGLLDRPRASGPLLRLAGWDMKTSFHKPTMAYLPMGSVVERGKAGDRLPFGFIDI